MKTSLPTALVFGWRELGVHTLQSDIYFEEYLFENVVIHCYDSFDNLSKLISKVSPDLIVTIGDDYQNIDLGGQSILEEKRIHYNNIIEDNVFANDIVCQSTFKACKIQNEVISDSNLPLISVFTPTYKTNERIFRTYESLKNQTYQNWEWVVVDDSPEGDYRTFEYVKSMAESDHRVKVYRITPNSNGNIGEVKHRAASLCDGEWLVELDHDDYLMKVALEEIVSASQKFDGGFIYSDCCELYDDGQMRRYSSHTGKDWYAHPENRFNWG